MVDEDGIAFAHQDALAIDKIRAIRDAIDVRGSSMWLGKAELESAAALWFERAAEAHPFIIAPDDRGAWCWLGFAWGQGWLVFDRKGVRLTEEFIDATLTRFCRRRLAVVGGR